MTATISTGRLPERPLVQTLLVEGHRRFASVTDGQVADDIEALATTPPDLFGACIVASDGRTHAVGDAHEPFSIQSVSTPFVFALVCDAIGPEAARRHLGVDGTGLPFNSVMAIELNADRTMNPMVNAGAIAEETCAPVLAVMATAGLYERSGTWMYDVGLPGKSGVSGGIVTVSPGKGGLGTFSPRLDAAGNSVRGQLLTRFLSDQLGLNIYASAPAARAGSHPA